MDKYIYLKGFDILKEGDEYFSPLTDEYKTLPKFIKDFNKNVYSYFRRRGTFFSSKKHKYFFRRKISKKNIG